ncbi:MAG: hypothetical protein M3R07_02465, partial [Gemmatimonadota bacterium]|nr:hypothetical protein [Gemmatimonadota bacterium]
MKKGIISICFAGAVAVAASPASGQAVVPTVITACYTQSGTVYVTQLPDAPADCHAQASAQNPHKPLVWNVQGPIGPVGPVGQPGPQGPNGAMGLQGQVGA